MMNDVNRTDTDKVSEYYGAGGDGAGASYNVGEYETTFRQEPVGLPISNATASVRNRGEADDFGVKGYGVQNNNRLTTNVGGETMGSVGGLVSAIVAPFMDVLRPTRKTNVVGNSRQSGNVGISMARGPVENSIQKPPTTNREMAVDKIGSDHWNYQGQSSDGYKVLDMRIDPNNRDTTSASYTGNAGKTNLGDRSYEGDYTQRNNVNKTYKNRPNHGGTQIFNQSMNVEVNRLERDSHNNRTMYPHGLTPTIPSMNQIGEVRTPSTQETVVASQSSDRMNPNDLSAFKANPYTHSLASW